MGGTAYGVVQAVNTFEHHERVVRGAARAERNMIRTISGDFGRLDRTTWRQLQTVLKGDPWGRPPGAARLGKCLLAAPHRPFRVARTLRRDERMGKKKKIACPDV